MFGGSPLKGVVKFEKFMDLAPDPVWLVFSKETLRTQEETQAQGKRWQCSEQLVLQAKERPWKKPGWPTPWSQTSGSRAGRTTFLFQLKEQY